MEKFKVKVDGKWVMCLDDGSVVICELAENAMICDSRAVTPTHLVSIIKLNNDVKVIEFIPVTTEKQPESKSKELDLCEILKDVPKGLKLWSMIFGDVELDSINHAGTGKVSFVNCGFVYRNGKYVHSPGGECILFPSKNNLDWSTFKLPYKLPVKGELCWTMSSVGNWIPRFATGEVSDKKEPIFFDNQDCKGTTRPYIWQPISEVPEVLKNHLKFK